MFRSLNFACHDAYMDSDTGSGLLVLPLPSRDQPEPGRVGSLHGADWDAVVRHLRGLGWEPTEDYDGSPVYEGQTAEGREAYGLCGPVPVGAVALPSDSDVAAFAALALWAGLRP